MDRLTNNDNIAFYAALHHSLQVLIFTIDILFGGSGLRGLTGSDNDQSRTIIGHQVS